MPNQPTTTPSATPAVNRLEMGVEAARGPEPSNMACYTCCGMGVRGCACLDGEPSQMPTTCQITFCFEA